MNSPNKALDRTAMSAVSSVIADSWPVAALMAVGQLGRSVTKHMKALATIFSFLWVSCPRHAQTPDTNRVLHVITSPNLMSIANAVRIASNLRVGMADADVQKYMQDHAVIQTNVNVYSISVDRGHTL